MASSANLVSLSPTSSPLSSSPSSAFTFPSLTSPRTPGHGFYLDFDSPSSSYTSFLPGSNSVSRSPSPSLPTTPRSPPLSCPSTPRSPPFRVSSYARSFSSTETRSDRFTSPPSLTCPGHRTHYSVLGVTPQASPKEIRVAYRRLALVHHPDVSPLHLLDTATKLFSEINEAYSTLADPQARAAYDLKLALESPVPVGATSVSSPRQYTDSSTGRVYPSMNSFYREWRQARN